MRCHTCEKGIIDLLTQHDWIRLSDGTVFCRRCARIEIERLQTIVATLPRCWRLTNGAWFRDVVVLPGMMLWLATPAVREYEVTAVRRDGWVSLEGGKGFTGRFQDELYSTREAAEKGHPDG